LKSWDIAAYQYKADTYCGTCVVKELCKDVGAEPPQGSTHEEELHVIAENLGIERLYESSFDSDDFPKVVFADQIEEDEHCCKCGEEL
jgi:hypothetical protein